MRLSRFPFLALVAVVTNFVSSGIDDPNTFAAEFADGRVSAAKGDWPWWRGPSGDGIADSDQAAPVQWSETENIGWKAAVPGRGHSSPTIVGNRVLLTTADEKEESQSVLCYDRRSGELLWQTKVHQGGMDRRGHKKSSQASATLACDGERIFAAFVHDGSVVATALDMNGGRIWERPLSTFVTHQGFGASPVIYRSLVIFATDNKAGGAVLALDRASGEPVWKYDRPQQPNYMSPTVLTVSGREQLLIAGCDHWLSLDPTSGARLWETEGSTTECVGSVVTDGTRVFASGGYPKKHTQAILADGSAKTAWQNDVQTYVPSMLVREGYLYTVTDAGVAICWDAKTGEKAWQSRLGGTFNASLVLCRDLIYAANQEGTTFVFKAQPGKFEAVAENRLGDEVYATPAICGGEIFLRVAKLEGEDRSEWLYRVGESPEKPAGSGSAE